MHLKVLNLPSQIKSNLSSCLNKFWNLVYLKNIKPYFYSDDFKVTTNLIMVASAVITMILAVVVVNQNTDLREIQISTAESIERYEAERLISDQIEEISKHLVELKSVEKSIRYLSRGLNRTRVSKVANNICHLERLEYFKKEVPKNIAIVNTVLNDLMSSTTLNVHQALSRINGMAEPFAQMKKRVASYEVILKNMEECLVEVQFL